MKNILKNVTGYPVADFIKESNSLAAHPTPYPTAPRTLNLPWSEYVSAGPGEIPKGTKGLGQSE
jgi:hypothetical protein